MKKRNYWHRLCLGERNYRGVEPTPMVGPWSKGLGVQEDCFAAAVSEEEQSWLKMRTCLEGSWLGLGSCPKQDYQRPPRRGGQAVKAWDK